MRLIDADHLTDIINRSYLTEGEKRLLSIKIRHEPTIIYTERPVCIIEGQIIYLNEGHIKAMIEYEKKECVKQVVDGIMKNLDEIQEATNGNS